MRDMYGRLLAFTGDGVYRYTYEEGRILSANQGFVDILDLGCAPEQVVGRLLKDVLVYVEKARSIRELLDQTGEIHGLEYHFRTLKGEDRWVIHDSFLLADPHTGEKVVEAIVKDITVRKKAEESLQQYRDHLETLVHERTAALSETNERLRREVQDRARAEQELRAALEREQAAAQSLVESELQYRMILRTTMDGFWLTDLRGKFLDVNDAYCMLTGRTREELLGMSIQDVEAVETPEQTERHIRELMEKGSNRFETRHRHKDGHAIDIEVCSNYSPGRGGRIFCFLRDISERKRADARLLRLMVSLARSNTELEQFAYVASHDMQEPLRKIQAFGDRLGAVCGNQLTEQGKEYVSRMQNAAGRMSRLITDLLAYSRLTSRSAPFVPVDLQRAVADVLGDLDLRIQQSGGRVEVGPLPTIEADPIQMGQLLQNLISNALKFHKPDLPPLVQIRAETVLLDGREFCRLAVADNGIGFDEKYLDRIFVIFQQLHPRGEYEGTGIGLAICRKIVERHAGTITARSRPGEGATFLVDLPFRQDSRQEAKE